MEINKCSICLDQIGDHEEKGIHLATDTVSHVYHKTCLEAWLNRKAECPLCKMPVNILPKMKGDDALYESEEQQSFPIRPHQVLEFVEGAFDRIFAALNSNQPRYKRFLKGVLISAALGPTAIACGAAGLVEMGYYAAANTMCPRR